ncbi:hypothetical protein BGE01nite_27880 [Brevifollis gellanilyticus]|uniref:Uncharacterized protein n=1 Tax=Brevifollis gellanilyticus TaxID=748831 RepID=A0A512M9T1_9BACT|nr:hypothetical protein BGE01nite_27880 [Brevifollis gellanilyticus]
MADELHLSGVSKPRLKVLITFNSIRIRLLGSKDNSLIVVRYLREDRNTLATSSHLLTAGQYNHVEVFKRISYSEN